MESASLQIVVSLFIIFVSFFIGGTLLDNGASPDVDEAPQTPAPRGRSRSRGPLTPKGSSRRPAPAKAVKAGPWDSENPAKRWFEDFSIYYGPVWIIGICGIIVPFKLYEVMEEWEYALVGLVVFLPTVLYPLLRPCKEDAERPLAERYWVKASLWIFIFGHIGNYFYTHYFYRVLGAKYTFKAHRLNDVPYCLYLITHAYFIFYHALSNKVLRRLRRATASASPLARVAIDSAAVFLVSYLTAVGETVTIAHYPHYNFTDVSAMYKYGTVFYAIYFWVSFPMFFVLEEDPRGPKWSLWHVTYHAMGAGMIVTWLLDAWRLFIGPIAPVDGKYNGLPWIS